MVLNMEGFFNDIKLPDLNQVSEEDGAFINTLIEKLGINAREIEGSFKNKDFFNALPQAWKDEPEILGQYMLHTVHFASIISQERKERAQRETGGLLGEKISLPPSMHADGRERRAEEGYRLNTEYLRSQGIDPSKVLFYRITQPSDEPKPELYWTSDLAEVGMGLTAEISPEKKESSVVIVCDLAALEKVGRGLIQDINDDGGMSVRMIEPVPFDQKNALFEVKKLTYLIYE